MAISRSAWISLAAKELANQGSIFPQTHATQLYHRELVRLRELEEVTVDPVECVTTTKKENSDFTARIITGRLK